MRFNKVRYYDSPVYIHLVACVVIVLHRRKTTCRTIAYFFIATTSAMIFAQNTRMSVARFISYVRDLFSTKVADDQLID